MKILGAVLVGIGAIALVYGGINYTKRKSIIDLGPVEITSTEHKSFPIPAAVGALVLVGGVVILVRGTRPSRAR
jgi:hypothetical protein